MTEGIPPRTVAWAITPAALDTGRRLKTFPGAVRLQVRVPWCRCTPSVPHAVDDGVCATCGNAIRHGVGQTTEEQA